MVNLTNIYDPQKAKRKREKGMKKTGNLEGS